MVVFYKYYIIIMCDYVEDKLKLVEQTFEWHYYTIISGNKTGTPEPKNQNQVTVMLTKPVVLHDVKKK